jgi:DNA repair exonuclease SbcCD ATPase subunit
MSKVKKCKLKISKLDRIIHISDIHVRNYKRHDEYRRVFHTLYNQLRETIKENDLICLTGDIVHSKTDVSPELFQEVQDLLKNLSEIAPVLMIPGNHDANLNNAHRMDALTPIVNAIDNDNFVYFKNSGILQIADVKFYHWSVFDEISKYPKRQVEDTCTSIALFHGLVNNSTTEDGFILQSESIKASMFSDFDLTLLGDIHKHQYLDENKTIAYPGSLIQQNHGEDLVHGYMIWDLNNKSSEFVEVVNDTAFYTIEINNGIYEKLPTNLQKNLYLRIKYKNTDQSTIKTIVNEIKQDHNIVELSYKPIRDFSARSSSANEVKGVDFRSVDQQKLLLKKYLNQKYKLSKESLSIIYAINDQVNKSLSKNEIPRNSLWLPKFFEFENMFSYGKDNHVDFSKMEGTYGIFAPNASGKSTLLDALTYCIFDKCTKTTRGHQVMNSSSNSFYCKLNFELNGIDYFIERNAKRQKNGNVRVEVDFYQLDREGNKTSLNGKERTDTNNNIKNLLGNYEDFVLTTLSTQSGNSGFIDMNQKDRKDLLSQFLDIGVFEELYSIANESSKEAGTIFKHHQKTDYEAELTIADSEIKEKQKLLDLKQKERNKLVKDRTNLSDRALQLATKLQLVDESLIDETMLIDRKNDANSILSSTLVKLKINEGKQTTNNEELDSIKKRLDLIDVTKIESDEKELKAQMTEYHNLNLEVKKMESDMLHKRKKMENLKELKYDPNCVYCMENVFVKDAIKTKDEIEKDELALSKILIAKSQLKDKLDESTKKNEAIKSEYSSLINQLNNCNKNNLIYQKESISLNDTIEKIKQGIQKIEDKLQERQRLEKTIQQNQKINDELVIVKLNLKTVEDSLNQIDDCISKTSIDVKVLENTIRSIHQKIEERNKYEEIYKHYQYYLEAVHRDGIPHDLIAITIPQIEEEVNNILSQLVDFKIVLQTDDKNVNAYIAYSEDHFWPLELTSGMEKFISSLAIRTSLIGISTLPRPNFIAIDEGFGALDKSNLSSMAMLFDYLKSQFKFILIISHIDSMRDIVDSHVEVNKINGKSNVKHN